MTGFALRETRGTPSSPISYACSATPCRHGESGGQIRIMDIVEEGWADFKKENAAKLTRPAVIEETEAEEEKEKQLGREKSKR